MTRHKLYRQFGLVISLCLSLLLIFPAQVAAVSIFYSENDIQFYNPNFDVQSAICAQSNLNLTGDSNVEKAFNFFTGKGLSDKGAAAILGNLMQESTVNVNPKAKQPGGPGRGIAQWSAGGRWDTTNPNLTDFAQKHGYNRWKLSTQLRYLWFEFKVKNYNNSYTLFKQANSLAAKTEVFVEKYEIAGAPHLDQRIKYAKQVLAKFGNGVSGGSGSSCGGAVVSVNGFAFPLKTTKSAIKNGVMYNGKRWLWCYKSMTSCHHDYNAADIHAKTGTVVVAARSGTVVDYDNGDVGRVQIITDKKGRLHYYTHMLTGSIVVEEGQHVEAGDVLGKIGNAADAMGTGPHLHFDILPKSFDYRPACSAAECTGYPFIDPQPALVKTFKLLPRK